MKRRRTVLSFVVLAAIAVALALGMPPSQRQDDRIGSGTDDVSPTAFTRSHDPLLERIGRHAVARVESDRATLAELALGSDPAALLAARDLVALADLDADVRWRMLQRIEALRIDDPLDRAGRTDLAVALAQAAEAAGETGAALASFREALPDPRAIEAVERLEPDAYRQANAYLQARLYDEALDALEGRIAPSIEAPAFRGLGRHAEGLDAYQRWLDEVPGDREALAGVAWSHWYLGDLDAAEAAFARLGGGTGAYGRALIANRRGDIDDAVRLLVSTGEARHMWLATSLLEREERWDEAVDVYATIAAGSSVYADDAAWRMRVLGLRYDRPSWIAAGESRLPDDGWFALRLGAPTPAPTRNDLPDIAPPAVSTARTLAEANELATARLVLAFALRDATQEAPAAGDEARHEATIVALGEALTALGEYRQPQRAVAPLMTAGSLQVRTWRLAYPEAWPELVRLEAKQAEVDPHLVWAVMRRESAFFPEAVSRSGAQGLMQVMPTTWTWLAEVRDETPGDPFDVADNVRYGITYLAWLDDYFEGDAFLVVPSYNRGQGYIRRLFDSPEVRRDDDELLRSIDALETREYLQAVLWTRHVYDALAEVDASLR